MTFHNLAREYTTTTGTADCVLTGAVPGCNTWVLAGVTNGESVRYGIITYDTSTHRPTHSEVGTGTFNTGTLTLARTTVEGSTNAGAKIVLTGLSEVYICPAASYYNGSMTKAPVMWHDQSLVIVGANITYAQDGGQAFNFVAYQDTGANADEWENGFVCQSGTYSIKILSSKDGSRGILDVYIDDVLISAGIDFYDAGTLNNEINTISSVVITDGYHTFKGIVNGKNGSSSGYNIAITKIWLVPASY